MGDDPLQAGMANFQATLESVDHSTGKFSAVPIPVPSGPRHPGHSDTAETGSEEIKQQTKSEMKSFMVNQWWGDFKK
jgi:hypothetical protein